MFTSNVIIPGFDLIFSEFINFKNNLFSNLFEQNFVKRATVQCKGVSVLFVVEREKKTSENAF